MICCRETELRDGPSDELARLLVDDGKLGVDGKELGRDEGAKGESDGGVEAQDLVDKARGCWFDESFGVGAKQVDDVRELCGDEMSSFLQDLGEEYAQLDLAARKVERASRSSILLPDKHE